MRSEWTLRIEDRFCVATRPWYSLLAPYLPFLAITIVWFPIAGFLLSTFDYATSSTTLGILFGLPVLTMGLWVPRLAAERGRSEVEVDDQLVIVNRVRFARVTLHSVMILPKWIGLRRGHRIAIAFRHDAANVVEPVATELHIENARMIAAQLAAWLGVAVDASTAQPPRAAIVRR